MYCTRSELIELIEQVDEIAAMAPGKAKAQRVSAYLDLVQCSEV